MELSGLKIFKHLPGGKKEDKANCKECGFATCMAFALKLAQKSTTIDKCPYCSSDFRALVSESFKTQQHEIVFGSNNVKTGGETVLYRHEKTFVNKPPILITLTTDDRDFDKKLDDIASYKAERIGELFKVDGIYLIDKGNLCKQAVKVDKTDLALVIESNAADECLKLKNLNPIFRLNSYNDEFKTANVIAYGASLEELEDSSKKLIERGFTNIVLEYGGINQTEIKTKLRRKAMQDKYEPFTYPVLTRLQHSDDIYDTACQASLALCRYSNVLVLNTFNKALLTTLFTLRQNIYADPQKPLQVEPKIYEINEPDEKAAVLMTTNFALSYYAVSNEIESIGIPAYLVVTAADGMSVLTAWSAEKLTASLVKKTIADSQLEKRISHRTMIIPGLLSHLKEELEEALGNWKIVVGPNEAYQLPEFMAKFRL